MAMVKTIVAFGNIFGSIKKNWKVSYNPVT